MNKAVWSSVPKLIHHRKVIGSSYHMCKTVPIAYCSTPSLASWIQMILYLLSTYRSPSSLILDREVQPIILSVIYT